MADRQHRSSVCWEHWIQGEADSRSCSPLEEKLSLQMGPSAAVSGTDGHCPAILFDSARPEAGTGEALSLSPPLDRR
ncbi:Hypothetical predicted protein [Pelobates cultripes]|uniref:Uncharacterized protein n=1 Tax=Pelobates cultripes TaxID=61616 RepID=A0AAD1SLR1_PELCU|nr:Hypothetical predicted protein [Pelobates cultripes]